MAALPQEPVLLFSRSDLFASETVPRTKLVPGAVGSTLLVELLSALLPSWTAGRVAVGFAPRLLEMSVLSVTVGFATVGSTTLLVELSAQSWTADRAAVGFARLLEELTALSVTAGFATVASTTLLVELSFLLPRTATALLAVGFTRLTELSALSVTVGFATAGSTTLLVELSFLLSKTAPARLTVGFTRLTERSPGGRGFFSSIFS